MQWWCCWLTAGLLQTPTVNPLRWSNLAYIVNFALHQFTSAPPHSNHHNRPYDLSGCLAIVTFSTIHSFEGSWQATVRTVRTSEQYLALRRRNFAMCGSALLCWAIAIWSSSSEVWSSSSAGALELHLPPLLLHAGTNKQTRAAAPLTPCQPCHPSSSPPAYLRNLPKVSAYQRHLVWSISRQCGPVYFLRKGDLDGRGEACGKTTDCFIERSSPRLWSHCLPCAALQCVLPRPRCH